MLVIVIVVAEAKVENEFHFLCRNIHLRDEGGKNEKHFKFPAFFYERTSFTFVGISKLNTKFTSFSKVNFPSFIPLIPY